MLITTRAERREALGRAHTITRNHRMVKVKIEPPSPGTSSKKRKNSANAPKQAAKKAKVDPDDDAATARKKLDDFYRYLYRRSVFASRCTAIPPFLVLMCRIRRHITFSTCASLAMHTATWTMTIML